VEGSIAEKTEQCIKNLKAILTEAGSGIPKVVKVGVSLITSSWMYACIEYSCFIPQVFLSDMKHFAEMNGEYEKWFTHKPARTCVAVRELPKGVDVEIEAIAVQ
jgi:enamine deaminase RidA (YjgF/YER057c/UK114 family)